MAPEDLLLAARDVMRERGMARSTFLDHDGSVCLAGAVKVASISLDYADIAMLYPAVSAALSAECSDRYARCISDANDACIASVDEACDVLDAAAKRAANKGVDDG